MIELLAYFPLYIFFSNITSVNYKYHSEQGLTDSKCLFMETNIKEREEMISLLLMKRSQNDITNHMNKALDIYLNHSTTS